MYNIDATNGALIQETTPNDGTLKAICKNMAYLAAGKTLYTIALKTGAATAVGAIAGVDNDVWDIAILPAM